MAAALKESDEAPPRSGPSLVIQLGLLVVLTVAAAGMGWVSGGFLNGGNGPGPAGSAHSAAPAGHEAAAGHDKDGEAGSSTVIPLQAITTNIGSPRDVWVRMEVSLVLDTPQGADLPDLVLQDFLAYIRTVKMHEIEGASGFRHLRENLEERAAIRSDGHVKQVLIRTLLFE